MIGHMNMLRDNRLYIVNEYNKHKCVAILAKQFKVNSGTMYYFLQESGVNIERKIKNIKALMEDNKYTIIDMFDKQNISMNQIAKKYNTSIHSIKRFLNKNGYDTSKFSKLREDPICNHYDDIFKLYSKNVSANQISKIYNCASNNIIKLLQKHGIETRDNRQYGVDSTFFDKVDNPTKAYILGWFYSDGTVNNAGKMRIQIQQSDKYILEQMKTILKYEGPIYDVPPPKKFPKRKHQVCLCINHKEMSKKLIELGCMPKKSLVLKFPITEQVPRELIWHFLRGVFDGDGSVSAYNASITSSSLFNQDLSALLDSYNISYSVYHKKNKKKSSSIMTTNLENTKKFLDLIYKDSGIHLIRKHNKYVELPEKTKKNQYG